VGQPFSKFDLLAHDTDRDASSMLLRRCDAAGSTIDEKAFEDA